MEEFIRARTAEQKERRLEQIKAEARAQFAQRPYHQITLTTVADGLGWSRANLYKYVATKEEIFLAVAADERDAYLEALLAAFPRGCGFGLETSAEVWAGIANAHRDWFCLGDILFSVIETNIRVERLMEFKRGYYELADALCERFGELFGLSPEGARLLLQAVDYHAVGLVGSCRANPLVREALERIGRPAEQVDFRERMRAFVLMCLKNACAQASGPRG